MSTSIPPRFSFSPLAPAKLLLVLGTGVAPALLILASDLPLWLRAWLWIPILGSSAVVTFGRVEGRSVAELLHSVLLFARRRRRRVWASRRLSKTGDVVAAVPLQPSEGIRRVARGAKRMGEAAAFYGTAFGITLAVAILLSLFLRWAITRVFAPPAVLHPVQASEVQQPSPASFSPSVSPLADPTPVPIPVPTPVPTPVLSVVWTAQESDWDLAAAPGYLALDNSGGIGCGVELAAPGWDYSVVIPPSEVTKVLVAPLLQPQAAWERLVVRSWCNLGVALVAFQPYRPEYSRLWLVPVCDPPGRVWIKPHEGVARVTILDREGAPLDASIVAPATGGWVPQAPTAGCWLYRVEAEQPVWLEVAVFWP